jgi:hypothetical protein
MDCVIIGNSDYNRKQMEEEVCSRLEISPSEFLEAIREYEIQGYDVKFETSLFRMIFGVTKYKVVGYRKYIPIRVRR